MAKTKRKLTVGSYHHVYNRGNNGQELFLDDADYLYYMDLLKTLVIKGIVSVYHYVLMPNHFHQLIKILKDGLSKEMHRIQLKYAIYYNNKYGKKGHVWQSRFRSKLIDSDAYLLQCGKYIEENPVRAKLVKKPQDWRWSSYRHYMGGTTDIPVTTDKRFLKLASKDNIRTKRYKDIVSSKHELYRNDGGLFDI